MILIGAGGHAKVVLDLLKARGIAASGYVDKAPRDWLAAYAPYMAEKELVARLPTHPLLILSFLGLDVESLRRRYTLMQDYKTKGAAFPPLIHPCAIVSADTIIGAGVQIHAGAIVGPQAVIAEGAVINSGALVEHEASIGAGAHIAPRAVVLGAGKVGACCYIGSGAVIVQNAQVPEKTFIKALSVWKKETRA